MKSIPHAERYTDAHDIRLELCVPISANHEKGRLLIMWTSSVPLCGPFIGVEQAMNPLSDSWLLYIARFGSAPRTVVLAQE